MMCKGANRPTASAKVAYESIEYGVWSIEYRERHYFRWRVAASGASGGKILNSRGDRKPGSWPEKNLLVSGLG
jgi:hypothetical protein